MRQNREDRFASGALNAPDGEAAEANPSVMRMASQSTTAITARFVGELKAQGEDEGQHELDKCFGVVKELQVGGFIVEIDGEGAVFAFRFGSLAHVSSPSGW